MAGFEKYKPLTQHLNEEFLCKTYFMIIFKLDMALIIVLTNNKKSLQFPFKLYIKWQVSKIRI